MGTYPTASRGAAQKICWPVKRVMRRSEVPAASKKCECTHSHDLFRWELDVMAGISKRPVPRVEPLERRIGASVPVMALVAAMASAYGGQGRRRVEKRGRGEAGCPGAAHLCADHPGQAAAIVIRRSGRRALLQLPEQLLRCVIRRASWPTWCGVAVLPRHRRPFVGRDVPGRGSLGEQFVQIPKSHPWRPVCQPVGPNPDRCHRSRRRRAVAHWSLAPVAETAGAQSGATPSVIAFLTIRTGRPQPFVAGPARKASRLFWAVTLFVVGIVSRNHVSVQTV